MQQDGIFLLAFRKQNHNNEYLMFSFLNAQTQYPMGSAAQSLGSPPCPYSVHSPCCCQDGGASFHLRNGPETSLNKQGACFSYKGSSFPFFGLFIRHPSTWYNLFLKNIYFYVIIFYPEVFYFILFFIGVWASLIAQSVKNPPVMQETWGLIPG